MTANTSKKPGREFDFAADTFNLTAGLPAMTHDKPGCPCGCGTTGLCLKVLTTIPDPAVRRRALAGRLGDAVRHAIEQAAQQIRQDRTLPLDLRDESTAYRTTTDQEADFERMIERMDAAASNALTWTRLQLALDATPLADENGKRTFRNNGEFMLMQVDKAGTLGFKHRQSRNYVFLHADGRFEVPASEHYFMRGTF